MRPRRPAIAVLATLCLIVAFPVLASGATGTRIDPDLQSLIDRVGPSGDIAAFVHFAQNVPYDAGVEAIRDAGGSISTDLPAGHLAYAYGPVPAFLSLATRPEVTFLEHGGTEPLLLETATWATRARTLYEETGGLDLRVREPDGDLIDGKGVGIAIVDSGVDGTHPDLEWAGSGGADPKTLLNFKVACTMVNLDDAGCLGGIVMQDVPDSDTSSGHGTHVAGIAAGSGIASDSDGDDTTTGDRMFRGVAPGAKLYGFGAGEGLSIFIPSAAAAFQWIYDNGLSQDPPIRVINNSWGGTGAHDPNLAISKLSNALVEDRDMTVVFASGNAGGDGTAISTNPYANNPTPGVISAANYNDANTGGRDLDLEASSSRGQSDLPETWPDVASPGTGITSTCKIATVVCPTGAPVAYPPNYTDATGTSMAAPHTSGVVALLYQADPSITPAEVEDVLEDNAHKFTAGAAYEADPANPDNQSSFDKGHGLVDARASVLETLGLPLNFGHAPAAGSPSVTIAAPSDGEVVPPSFPVSGGADPGGLAPTGSTTTVIAEGDSGDHPDDVLDLDSVTVTEDTSLGTVTIAWTVAAVGAPPGGESSYRLFTSVDGVPLDLQVTWDGTTLTCTGDLLATCVPGVAGNTFSATFTDAAAFGASRGAVMFDSWAATYAGAIQDRAPGGEGATFVSAPARGQEHVFVATSGGGPGALGEVFVSVDGGTPESAGTGSGPFTWSNAVGPLTPGPHALIAELEVSGNPVATDTANVTVAESTTEPSIVLVAPDDNTEVPASLIEVRGISNSDASDGTASVRIRATDPGFDSGFIDAADTSVSGRFTTWAADLNLDGLGGRTVTIVSELRLNGTTAATDEVQVTVKAPAGPAAPVAGGSNVLCPGKAPPSATHVVGTGGKDVLIGTPGPDVICGLGGGDRLKGLGDADVLLGGPGSDVLSGGGGKDRLKGGPGKDDLLGGAQRDILNAGPGNDECSGSGSDRLRNC